jgi:hypothetical protein
MGVEGSLTARQYIGRFPPDCESEAAPLDRQELKILTTVAIDKDAHRA